ncbi:MAG: hypothetical protein ACE5SW_09710, partial [Nitrososphaeraceae archaeon]
MHCKYIEIELFSILFCIFTIILVIFIIDYIHPFTHLLYLYAEPNKNSDKDKEENQIDEKVEKKEQEQTKDSNKEKNKEKDNKNGNEKKSNKNKDSLYSAAQLDPSVYLSFFPIKQIDIPKIYQTKQNGETYRFNVTNPNGLVQVDETEKDNIFTKQNIDGSWRIDFGRPRIDIHTKDAGIIPDKAFLEENLSKNIIKHWDFSELKEKGYWYKPTDWKNIEVTL